MIGTDAGGILPCFALLHVPVNIFHNHNAVVHQHTQGQYQREEHHHIQGYIKTGQQGEGDKHGIGNRQGHKNGRLASDEDKNDHNYENQTGDYIVFQIGHHEPHVIGHVRGQIYFQGLRQLRSHLVDNAFDFIGHPYDVFAAALGYRNRYAFSLVDPAAG